MALLSAHHWLGNQADCGKEQMRQGGRQCNLVAEEGRGRVCAAKKKKKMSPVLLMNTHQVIH